MRRKDHLYRTVVSAAAIDGRIGETEKALLRKLRKRLGLTAARAKTIDQKVLSGKPTFFVPRDAATRASLFDDVEKVLRADGTVSAKERSFLRKVRARYTKDSARCPRCAVGLWASASRYGCRECGGVWIPGGERDSVRLNVELRKWVRDYTSTRSTEEGWGGRTCPACERHLQVFTYGPPPERVYIEPCPGCRGIFVEPDQKDRMIELARDECKLSTRRHQEAQAWALIDALADRWR